MATYTKSTPSKQNTHVAATKSGIITDDLISPEALETLVVDAMSCAGVVPSVGTAAVGDPSIMITNVLEGTFSAVNVGAAVLLPPVTLGVAEVRPVRVVVMSLALLVPYWEVREAQLESSKLVSSVHSEELMTPFVTWQ
jgi:hypothetical protein